ncbi:hypothetical protein [Catellatospora tritici]|uniref:hypothetical protein n=1 Tax=Catellatospora tritici TaxID=2851566 RepID=UPI001C2DB169|nr:hypothetical protein [Catellatospora tritici]MBV1853548.1 hypothetical protein [Catellatospora tritici]
MSRPATATAPHLPVRGAGLLLGTDSRRHAPVLLRLFHPRPRRVAALGDDWLARLLVFRALALGARVWVRTPDPRPWLEFGAQATGRPDRLLTVAPHHAVAAEGAPARPVLVVDAHALECAEQPLAAWHTQLQLLPAVPSLAGDLIRQADVVISRQLDERAAHVVADALRLRQHETARLQALFSDIVAVFGADLNHRVTIALTPLEQSLVGLPGRVG